MDISLIPSTIRLPMYPSVQKSLYLQVKKGVDEMERLGLPPSYLLKILYKFSDDKTKLVFNKLYKNDDKDINFYDYSWELILKYTEPKERNTEYKLVIDQYCRIIRSTLEYPPRNSGFFSWLPPSIRKQKFFQRRDVVVAICIPHSVVKRLQENKKKIEDKKNGGILMKDDKIIRTEKHKIIDEKKAVNIPGDDKKAVIKNEMDKTAFNLNKDNKKLVERRNKHRCDKKQKLDLIEGGNEKHGIEVDRNFVGSKNIKESNAEAEDKNVQIPKNLTKIPAKNETEPSTVADKSPSSDLKDVKKMFDCLQQLSQKLETQDFENLMFSKFPLLLNANRDGDDHDVNDKKWNLSKISTISRYVKLPEKKPYILLNVNGRDFTSLVNEDAKFCMISESFLRYLKVDVFKTNFRQLQGTVIPVLGFVNLDIKVGKFYCKQIFFVCKDEDIGEDMILGETYLGSSYGWIGFFEKERLLLFISHNGNHCYVKMIW